MVSLVGHLLGAGSADALQRPDADDHRDRLATSRGSVRHIAETGANGGEAPLGGGAHRSMDPIGINSV
jgi:hypothetical protein